MGTSLILLAAGKGTRMNSDLPKVLHEVAGAPLLAHALRSGQALDPERIVVVAGHGSESVRVSVEDWAPEATVVVQEEQLGTGHAVAQARDALRGAEGDAVVLYGDTPFIRPETLQAMAEARATHDIVVLGFEARDPGRYGRLVTEGDDLIRIVEFKDASEEERALNLCNSGLLCAKADLLLELVGELSNENASGEYYLTDVPALARERGLSATVVRCDEAETMGVNSRADLAAAEVAYQDRARQDALETGVTLTDPATVHLAFDTVIGRDTVIEPNVVFGPGVTVESGARIRAFSHLEGCHVSRGAVIGPYARLRPGAELGEDVRVGNFVEVKNAVIGEGAKVPHLSYIGDADIGRRSNIGAGSITCNYDGVFKHRTRVGEGVFVGSNTMLVAPVTLGDQSMTASGSVITRDVAPGDLAIARARQDAKPGFAQRFFERLRAKKASQKG
ncbi:bifunctional UDP-N-acetylglucosamine diphosphorylase/glucosamine-1-phosphate N-acetyltransferase GlmU [Histidinibacterium aquaticum]|uniref:Bifunctional protein GlmU n=1 Tax=Histidinibacterium aquaticum TaxID=2613962 RepID=A0A5J5GNX1_9RHOB|nr:bifunctional UDP-N-acetylglucosamine diphosphorylase/glucosamine-1-phosphate N-acetyltransferase GlmU [Histidinibacterium aquaticum]KAA9009747.1 bifunctional UDP-N-acetylglucosamine diphosphorylase/glucosamine-1-phosphate N-acetyltransferase GlmU [Histidinibacterium aquaticum]